MHIARDAYLVSDDKARLDIDRVHAWIASTYWARNIPRAVLEQAIEGSLCFALYRGETQAGFARVVTDFATFAYLCDVFVDEAHRGQGLGEWLVECVHAHPKLQGLRRWMLATRDAHALYARLGWTPVTDPKPLMQKHDPDVYTRALTD